MVIRIHAGHRHDFLYIGINGNGISVPILHEEPYIPEFADGPGGRIVHLLRAVLRIIVSHDAGLRDAHLFRHFLRRQACVSIDGTGPVAVPVRQLAEDLIAEALRRVGLICPLRKIMHEVKRIEHGLIAALCRQELRYRRRGLPGYLRHRRGMPGQC